MFDYTLDVAWNETRGGIYYTFDRDGEILIDEKFYWVMTEAFSSAALLADRPGNDGYWDWYDRIWSYSENHLVNEDLGIWYRLLDAGNELAPNIDKTPRVKTDYHTVGACYEVIKTLRGGVAAE